MAAATENTQAVSQEKPAPKVLEGFRVYLGGLPFSYTEEDVSSFVAKVGGDIEGIIVPPAKFGRRHGPGFAFVHYKTETDAQKAVAELDGNDLEGRKVSAALGRSKEEQAARREEHIQKRDAARAERASKAQADGTATTDAEGEKPKRAPRRRNRRRVPGEDDGEDADNTGETTVVDTDASPVQASTRRQRKPKKVAEEGRIDAEGETGEQTEKPKRVRAPKTKLVPTGADSATTIFVGNLPFTVNDSALAEVFTNLSIQVKSAKIVRGMRQTKTGRPFRASRGFGFVELENPAQQQEAVDKVSGSKIGDREISARVAKEVKEADIQESEAQVAPAAAEAVAA